MATPVVSDASVAPGARSACALGRAIAVDRSRRSSASSRSCGRSSSRRASSAARTRRAAACSARCCCSCSRSCSPRSPTAASTRRRSRCSACSPRSTPALRPLGAGTAGRRDHVLRARPRRAACFGPGLRLRARLHVAVRVGDHHRRRRTVDAVPDVRLRVGRAGRRTAAAGATGSAEIAMLAAYGVRRRRTSSGFMLNLSFWPFSLDPGSSIAYLPGASFADAVAPLPGLRRHHFARLGHRPARSPTCSASCSSARPCSPPSAAPPAGRRSALPVAFRPDTAVAPSRSDERAAAEPA